MAKLMAKDHQPGVTDFRPQLVKFQRTKEEVAITVSIPPTGARTIIRALRKEQR